MLEKLRPYKKSIWRVPLIAIIAGYFYVPLYVRIVIQFGVIEPGVIDDRVSLMTSAGILLAVLVLGGIFLLRRLSRKEIFVSALENHFEVSLPIIWWLRVFVPFLFILFGKKVNKIV